MHSLPSLVHNYRHYSDFAEDNDTDIEEAQWASYYEVIIIFYYYVLFLLVEVSIIILITNQNL